MPLQVPSADDARRICEVAQASRPVIILAARRRRNSQPRTLSGLRYTGELHTAIRTLKRRKRRAPLVAAAALFLALLATNHGLAQSATTGKDFSREAILTDVARNVIVPAYQDLGVKCRDLSNALAQFAQATNQVSLDTAREAWLAAGNAANRMRCYQIGPIADRDSVSTFYYWQVLPNSIEAVIRDAAHAINQPLLDEAGSTTKGLYALEYLLFDRKGGQATEPMESAKALDLLSASQRRREYLLAVARDVEARAGQLAKDWTDANGQSALAKFVSGGQESLNPLVNQLCQSIETTSEKRLNFVLILPNPISHQLFRVEGARSGSSLQGVLATLDGIDKIYRGCNGLGIESALKDLNPALAQRVREQFDAGIAATRAIGAPLEQAAVDKRAAIQNACEKVHALEILFKVDITSALGVTLTFTSGDGD